MKKTVFLLIFLLMGSFFLLGGAGNFRGNFFWAQETIKSLISRTPLGEPLAKLKHDFWDAPYLEVPTPKEKGKDSRGIEIPKSLAVNSEGFLENCAILIPSCDKYHSAWKPFFSLLFKYWPNFQQPVYLITNKKSYDDPRVKVIQIPNEVSWSDNMMQALEQIKEDYVMIILEDFMISSPVQGGQIREYFEIFKKERGAFLQLMVGPFYPTTRPIPALRLKGAEEKFYINCQLGIWRKEALKKLLVRHENPWQFEVYGSWRAERASYPVMSISEEAWQPIFYRHAIVGGHWVPGIKEFLEKEGIPFETDLPIEIFSYGDNCARVMPFPKFESFRVPSL